MVENIEKLGEVLPPENIGSEEPFPMDMPAQQPQLLPYLQEQSITLAEKVVVRSLDNIPDEIFNYFWHTFGIDLLVNNFYERDLQWLEIQIFRTILNHLAYIPIRDLRKPVEIVIPKIEPVYEVVTYEDGTTALKKVDEKKKYVKYKLKNVYWDELIDMIITRALIMAKRSRQGFTMDKLTSFKTIQGWNVEEMREKKARII